MSLPSRERGLKHPSQSKEFVEFGVAPLAGAWIETCAFCRLQVSHLVAPLAGAWIETKNVCFRFVYCEVAPLAGAWIETFCSGVNFAVFTSLPSRERGLKP